MTILDLTAAVDTDAQNMYKDLADDIIQAVGTNFYYLPKERLDVDVLLREDVQRVFKDSYVIEGWIKNKNQYQHSINLQTKYGTDYREYLTLCITKRRFHEVLPSEFVRPKTGDLIYSPVFNGLFTINYTEHELPFYELQQLTFYELYLERYVYNNDTLETGIESVDDIQYNYGYRITVDYQNLNGSLSVGTKVSQIINSIIVTGKIASIDLVNEKIVITDITSNDELNLNFSESDVYSVYDINDNTNNFQILKLYDINEETIDPIIPTAANTYLNNDPKDHMEEPTNNPFWGG